MIDCDFYCTVYLMLGGLFEMTAPYGVIALTALIIIGVMKK